MKKIKFKEISVEELNCGWCVTGGVIIGAGGLAGLAILT